jgi:hypothetical protein
MKKIKNLGANPVKKGTHYIIIIGIITKRREKTVYVTL